MELYKLTDENLINMLNFQERITELVIPELLSSIDIKVTGNIDEAMIDTMNGEVEPIIIPQIQLISFYISPIFEMEKELDDRGLLKKYRENTPFADYENYELLIYEKYEDRLAHLFQLNEKGMLTREQIENALEFINNNEILKQSLLN